MLRRTPLKRTGFKVKPRHQPNVEREPKPLAKATRPMVYAGALQPAKPKDNPLRSEAYRRLVAAMPCACGCLRQPCQCAHPNTGKGMALKTDDRRCFPLYPECHAAFDQGLMFRKEDRRKAEEVWGEQTRAAILAAGTWPKNLPLWRST